MSIQSRDSDGSNEVTIEEDEQSPLVSVLNKDGRRQIKGTVLGKNSERGKSSVSSPHRVRNRIP